MMSVAIAAFIVFHGFPSGPSPDFWYLAPAPQ